MKDSSRRIITIVAAVAIVALLAGGAMFSSTGGESADSGDGSGAASVSESPVDPKAAEKEAGLTRRDAGDVTALGDEDAPIVLIEYSDYRCPFCGAFARDTLPELKKEYIDTGKVRFEWRDFPVFGEESMDGAMAARAAGEQDLYWEYQEAMYEDAPERGHLKITRKKIMAWAEEVGVKDLEQFEQDLDDSDLKAKVEADATEARSVGATGTPTFVIGTKLLVGAQPADAFRQALDEQLEALGEK